MKTSSQSLKPLSRLRTLNQEEEADSEGSWAISYGDMITLLLTFFILFFNVNQNEQESKTSIEKELLAKLRLNLNDPKSEAEIKAITQSIKSDVPIKKIEHPLNGIIPKTPEIEDEMIQKINAKVKVEGSRIVVDFPHISFFKSGAVELSLIGRKTLTQFTSTFLPYAGNHRVVIKAYTDEKPVIQSEEKPYKNNLELSALRSVATAKMLQHAGIPLNRLMPSGFGEIKVKREKKVDHELSRKIVLIIEPMTDENSEEST